jgi:hypothetical protein
LAGIFSEDLVQMLQVNASVNDRQPLAERGDGSHQYIQRYVSPGFQIGNCLAPNAYPFGNPGLGTTASLAFSPNALTQVFCCKRDVQ